MKTIQLTIQVIAAMLLGLALITLAEVLRNATH